MKTPLPSSESKRVAALRQYSILDTAAEQSFDDLAMLAACLCGTPVALVSLVDEQRQWFKASIGWSVRETPRDLSICAYAIEQRVVFTVKDARVDERFSTNKLVVGEPHICFYAGAPLVTPDGEAIGTVCVIDWVPRELSQSQLEALPALSRQVMKQLELRRLLLEQREILAERERIEHALRASEEQLARAVRGADFGAVEQSRAGARPRDGSPFASKPLRVLVADDHDIVQHGLKQLLLANFNEIVFGEAKNAQETIAQCAREQWDVVLLDITLPGRSGLDILGDLKRIAPEVPILIMSAFPEGEFAVRALKSGASGYLDKQTLAAEVVAAIHRVLMGEHYVGAALASKLAAQIGGGIRPAHETLSQREFQVLRMIATGKTIKEIASDLSLSEKTVGTYRTRISEKLGLGTNVEITRYAMQHRLVE